MSRRIILVTIWLVGTALAALSATLGVNLIGGRLTSPRLIPLSQADVVSQAAARTASTSTPPSTADDPTTTTEAGSTTTSSAGATTTTAPPRDDRAVTTTTAPSPPTTGVAPRPPESRPTTTVPSGGDHDGDREGGSGPLPTTTSTASPSAPVTFTLVGGTVTARCDGSTITVVSYAPAAGFHYDGGTSAGTEIDVRFRANDGSHDSELRASCSGGSPVATEIREH